VRSPVKVAMVIMAPAVLLRRVSVAAVLGIIFIFWYILTEYTLELCLVGFSHASSMVSTFFHVCLALSDGHLRM